MITIREVEDKDIIPLAEFLPTGIPLKNTTKEIWLSRFNIWWSENPAYTDIFPKGWILENDSTIVGFLGNIPVKFLLCGEIKTAVAAVSWYVDPSVRGLSSLRLFNEYHNQKHASLYLFNADNIDVMKIAIKNKYKEYIVPHFQTKYLYIINRTKVDYSLMNYILRKYLFCGSIPRLNEVPAFISRFWLLLCAYVYQKPVVHMSALPDDEYATSLCTSCDDSFVRIWEPHLKACDITLSRDTKTLNWIYFSSIYPKTRVVIQCRRTRDNSLAGYMVFDIVRKKTSDVARMQLMDMCLEKHDPRVLVSLLTFAIDIGKQYKAAFMDLWADSPETELFLHRNFTMKMDSRQHNFIRFSDIQKDNSGSVQVCPSMIAPPRGIEHFSI
jgi:hypothetical protein